MAELQYISDYITYDSNICLAKSSSCCWLWRRKLLYVVSCLWKEPCMKLRKVSSWQPAENWDPYGDSLILPQLNLWWDSSHCQRLDCSLTDDPLQPRVFSNAVAWGTHSALTNAQAQIVGELMPVGWLLNTGQWRVWIHTSPLPP